MSRLPDPGTLAATIDHTNLKAEATPDDIRSLCDEALQHGFAAVCVNAVYVKPAADVLQGSDVDVCSVVGFPLGSVPTSVKVFETRQALADGATEIDMVIPVGALRADLDEQVRTDIEGVVRAVRDAAPNGVVKVILECGALTDDEIIRACRCARAAGADYVKTSTGMHASGGATVRTVQLLRDHADGMKVKAAGGIRTLDDAMAMLDAGADRLGTSSGKALVEELRRRLAR